ncbi:MAG: hypothetical protein EOO70_00090 [Myxococcaceae bacterium]|nr:MAG: hypothetical protein EOO70_00090 [Myxococcaceae bacterium]
MSYQYLLETQAETATRTTRKLNGVAANMPVVIDSLFQLSSLQKFGPDETGFNFWAWNALLGVPYTVAGVYSLWLQGSYSESLVLIRQLFEILVQTRFYDQNREVYWAHCRYDMARRGQAIPPTGPQPARPIFKRMFDEVAPGLYQRFYGQQLSSAAHGGQFSTVFRSRAVGEGGGFQHVPGARLLEGEASYVLTYLTPVLHGLIRIHLRLSPELLGNADPAVQVGVEAAAEWLRRSLQADWDQYQDKRDLLTALAPLVEWRVRT